MFGSQLTLGMILLGFTCHRVKKCGKIPLGMVKYGNQFASHTFCGLPHLSKVSCGRLCLATKHPFILTRWSSTPFGPTLLYLYTTQRTPPHDVDRRKSFGGAPHVTPARRCWSIIGRTDRRTEAHATECVHCHMDAGRTRWAIGHRPANFRFYLTNIIQS